MNAWYFHHIHHPLLKHTLAREEEKGYWQFSGGKMELIGSRILI
jgi:hypothetical protein